MVALRDKARLDEAMKLLFFGFRSVTSDPDRILAKRGLGRVHHRVLFFVARTPHITIGELLEVLAVSKQALHRPLTELIRRKLLVAEPCETNRRTKELRLTKRGEAFEDRLSATQRARFERAFEAAGPEGERGFCGVMRALFEDKTPSIDDEVEQDAPSERRAD